jgi:hypothetical protein
MNGDENPIHIWHNVQKHLSIRIVRSMIIGAVVGSTSLSSIYFAQVAFHQNEEHRSFWGLFLIGAAVGAFLGYLLVKDGKEVDVTGSQIASDPSVAQRLTAAQPTADLLSISKEATLSVNTDNNLSSSVKPAEKERHLRGIPRWTLLRHEHSHFVNPTKAVAVFLLIHKMAGIAVMSAFFATALAGPFFFYLWAFGYEKSTLDGITIRYHKPLDLLYGLAFAALPLAAAFSIGRIKTEKMQGFKKVLDNFIHFTIAIAFLIGCFGMYLFFNGACNWIRIDSDQVTTGFFLKKSFRFEQISEVEFTEVSTAHKEKNGSISYTYSPAVEFTLSSSEKVTWPGEPMIYVEQEFQQMLELKEIPYSTRRSQSYLPEKNEFSIANQAGSISAATPAASIANRQSTADYVAQIRAKRDLEEIVGSRWRHFSNFRIREGEEMIIEFRSDMTGTIQVKLGPQTVVDTQMTFEVVSERIKSWSTLHITSSDQSTANASIVVNGDHARFHSPSANGQFAEEIARFFEIGNRFERQPLDPANAK